jgi:hypothetical protein
MAYSRSGARKRANVSKVAREYLGLGSQGRVWTHLVCRDGLRTRWHGIARRWTRIHKHIFDRDDLGLTVNQRAYHFAEWVAAIHFGETRRVRAVVGKWKEAGAGGRRGFKMYPENAAIVRRQMGERRYDVLRRRLRGSGRISFSTTLGAAATGSLRSRRRVIV